ncbi:cystine/glutamate transporter-like [Physella acuta]|uniref:cystine/glutamate transporter-like n=1 Tax=Physella acuta TaxID=109671 RepID=UPI0027DD2B05|nr:cystine/glutamate transporter-like [Physella acuta]XP_059162939.1 cystine/glutamate transporter-like [Physella acuta]
MAIMDVIAEKSDKLMPEISADIIIEKPKVFLKKRISLFQCVSIIVGIIVGSGIFVSPVGITAQVQSVGMSLVMWGVVGLYSTLCALCYAELGASLPESGGEYVYIRHAWGDFAAFLCLWMNMVIISPACVAAASLIFASYILKMVFINCEPPEQPVKLIAFLIIALVIVVNWYNVNWATKLQVVITSCKLLALLTIVIIGFYTLGQGNTENFKDAFEGSDYSAGAISIAFYCGFWAYGGWNYLNFLTEEVIKPHRNLPLGVIISIPIVTVIYITVNVAYFSVLTPMEMLQSSAVAVTFLERTVRSLSYVIPVMISISVVGSINGAVLGMSRLFCVAARNNHLPLIFSMVHIHTSIPRPSFLIMFIFVVLMQMFGDIFLLIEMMGFCLSIVLTLVFSGQVLMRRTKPNLSRPIKLPWILPVVLCLSSLAILITTVYQKPSESCLALMVVACGLPAYLLGSKCRKPQYIQRVIDQATRILQILMQVYPPDKQGSKETTRN